jgi:hypothetical protein
LPKLPPSVHPWPVGVGSRYGPAPPCNRGLLVLSTVTLRSVVAITAILAMLAVCGAARADADPASDVLYTNDVFLPLSTKVEPRLARQLADAAKAANAAGKPVRIALIAAPADLGGVPILFGKPTDYARFLGTELQFVYTGRLLIVMPQGAALAERGRLVANAAVVRAIVGSGGNGLARTAITLVQALTGKAPKPPPASARGFPVWKSTAIAAGGVCALLLCGLILLRRRLRGRQLEQPRTNPDVVPDPHDPSRYKGP